LGDGMVKVKEKIGKFAGCPDSMYVQGVQNLRVSGTWVSRNWIFHRLDFGRVADAVELFGKWK